MEIKKIEIFEGKLNVDNLVETKKIIDDYMTILN